MKRNGMGLLRGVSEKEKRALSLFSLCLFVVLWLLICVGSLRADYEKANSSEYSPFISNDIYLWYYDANDTGPGGTVTIAPDASDASKTPLILIHGIDAKHVPGHVGVDGWYEFVRFFNSSPELTSKYHLYVVGYESNMASVEQLGEDFATVLNKLDISSSSGFQQKKFIVIAHSMGVLVSRVMMNQTQANGTKSKWGDRVIKLITLATPHHGTPIANGMQSPGPLNDAFGVFGGAQRVETVFGQAYNWAVNYTQPNRSDLLWDNYDGLYTHFFGDTFEQQPWLLTFNSQLTYVNKLILYAGTYTSGSHPPYTGNILGIPYDAQWILATGLSLPSDGMVPEGSALFDGVGIPNSAIRIPAGNYDHTQMRRGQNYNVGPNVDNSSEPLFASLRDDLLSAIPPATPANLIATAVSSSQINLTWPDVANETGYNLERRLGPSGSWSQIATPSANVTSFSDTGLVAGTAYSYQVRAYNAAGDSAYSPIASATTQSPPGTGSLTMNLFPTGAVSAGAQWRVDGGSYYNSGATVTNLTSGSHPVSFKTVTGYTTPADKSVTITDGVNITDSGTYTVISGGAPVLTTTSATSITSTSATLNGTIANNSGASIDERRFSWGLTSSCSDGWVTDNPASPNYGYIAISGNFFGYNRTGLQPNTTYYFQPWAHNSVGWGKGTPMPFTTSAVGIFSPTVATTAATGIGQTSATLNGTVNPNGGNTTGYFQYGTTAGYGSQTSTQGLGSGSSNVSLTVSISGLTCNTPYHYRAVGANSGGTNAGLDMTFTTSACSGTTPPTVTTSSATNITGTSATLTGTVNPNGASTTAYFQFNSTTTIGNTAVQNMGAGTSAVAILGGNISGLTCNMLYHFRAVGTNSAGMTTGADMTFTTPACTVTPPTMSTSSATNITGTSATLNGMANPNGANTTTYFQYGASTSYGNTTAVYFIGPGTSTVAIPGGGISGLTCNMLYHYRAVGTNSGGTNYGSDMTFTTSACSATPPTVSTSSATNITGTSATLNGTVNPNGANTTAYFQYGTTTGYGSTTAIQNMGAGTSAVALPGGSISGLTCNTPYHYRAVGANSGGTNTGSDMNFTTSACSVTPFHLPDTGQTECYDSSNIEVGCSGTGQDGAYTINTMSFKANGAGTVTDNNTGLLWQQQDDGNTYNWYQATGTYDATYNPSSQNVCRSLNLGGYSDWRLPSKKELISIVDYSSPSPGPTINPVFTNTKAPYWSSTIFAGNLNRPWSVFFNYGYVTSGYDKANPMYVRCVRGGQLDFGNFDDNFNGTVTDNSTGLMWQQSEPEGMTWSNALNYCENLELPSGSGQTDWRLPNIKELESITDDAKYNPSIDGNFFPNASESYHWSSTTDASDPGSAWGVGFGSGSVDYGSKDGSYYVRCVRGGHGSLDNWVISGSVKTAAATISGVTMTLSGAASGTTTTDASGNYAFTGLVNGNYIVTPSMTGYTFARPNKSVTVNGADILGQNFTAVGGNAIAFNLPDTGQTKCYQAVNPYGEIPCGGTGQDGAYNINPMSFTGNGNGTVTDNNTGLMWQQQDDGNTYNWYEASGTYDALYNPTSQDVCGALSTGSYTDWRLPSKKELISIVDYSNPVPRINPIFSNTNPWAYWSFTTYASAPYAAWYVHYGNGSVYYGDKDGDMYIRCVRGGQSGSLGKFDDNHDGTITDTSTGLMWQQSEPGAMPWSNALNYCENLELPTGSGQKDWRLPNIKELESITGDTTYNPAIDRNFFPNASASYYWSSTTMWDVDFGSGYVYGYNYHDEYNSYVRCVRGGQSGPPVVTATTPTNNTKPTWTWTTGGGGNGTFRYRLDNPVLTTGATTTALKSFTPATALAAGNHTLYVQEKNALGLWSATGSKLVLIETTKPINGTVTATPGAGQIALRWSGFTDAASGIGGYKIVYAKGTAPTSCSTGTVLSDYDGVSSGYTHTGLTNATYGYRVCAIDKAGNMSTGATKSARPLPTEAVPPVGSIIINNGAAWTKSASVALTLTATDDSLPIQMCISNTASCTAWTAFAATKTWTLATGNGTKKVKEVVPKIWTIV